jgi:hypothetical protein
MDIRVSAKIAGRDDRVVRTLSVSEDFGSWSTRDQVAEVQWRLRNVIQDQTIRVTAFDEL